MRYIEQPKLHDKYTIEQGSKILREKVPIQLRCNAIYTPLVSMVTALALAQQIKNLLAASRISATKKPCRRLQEFIDTHHKLLEEDLNERLDNAYDNFLELSNGVLDELKPHLNIMKIQYHNILLNHPSCSGLHSSVVDLVAYCFVVIDLVKITNDIDAANTKEIARLLKGTKITFDISPIRRRVQDGLTSNLKAIVAALGASAYILPNDNAKAAYKAVYNFFVGLDMLKWMGFTESEIKKLHTK